LGFGRPYGTFYSRPWLLDKDRDILYELAQRNHLWSQRVAIITCFAFIRKGQFTDAIRLCEGFLTHRHDLIHKATGWMLREIGKRDELVLKEFLDEHVLAMPRTMLRYAIEKLPPAERKAYLLAK
jgi:3-methyladenine DNA glycosylase AlkD